MLAALLFGCGSVDHDQIRNLRQGKIEVSGHAGVGFANIMNPYNPLPANSMASIKEAFRQGAVSIEVDVQITADSVLVLYHDSKLDSKTTGQGCIPELPASEVIGIEYRVGFPFDLVQSEKLISLQELADTLKKRRAFPKLYLDLHAFNKCNQADGYRMAEAIALALADFARKNSIDPRLIRPMSTVPDLLNRIRNHQPNFYLIYEETGDFEKGMQRILDNRYPALAIKPSLLDTNVTNTAHKYGVEVITFGGKSSTGLAKMVRQNPDVIQADNVQGLVNLLQED